MRQPKFAGQFYPAENVNETIEDCYYHPLGPQDTPLKETNAIISPHAGYVFSGPCAAWGYGSLNPNADIYFIFGVNHRTEEICFSNEDWKLPNGTLVTNDELIAKLSKETRITIKNEAHTFEHSIEVQLPFLIHMLKTRRTKKTEPTIVPLMLGGELNFMDFEKIADVIVKETKYDEAAFIASSDFTHYGPAYRYIPFKGNNDEKKEKLETLDAGAIRYILNLETNEFLTYLDETNATICGKNTIALLIELMKEIGTTHGKLISYYNSGEIYGEYENMVDYASIIFTDDQH